ncbi:aspartyl-phosphate phosphatase Spo0E family protein [Brevibacillus porteri]|nr:aspartyl-phosphate phosphatase Spo0E family protein [Brevibacillus porteri]MED2894955.1 aspartyl-phosphate phosphatase Spo0E family protein [Brevibacillus porteri]
MWNNYGNNWCKLFLEKNDLLDDEVVKLSQQLDQYILVIQSRMMQK